MLLHIVLSEYLLVPYHGSRSERSLTAVNPVRQPRYQVGENCQQQ